MIESLMFNYLLVLLIRDDAVGFQFVLASTPTLLSINFGTVVFARPPDTRRLSNLFDVDFKYNPCTPRD